MATKWIAIGRQLFVRTHVRYILQIQLKNVNQRCVALWILPLKKGYPEQVALKKASKQTKFSVFIAVILVELLKEYLYSFTYKF